MAKTIIESIQRHTTFDVDAQTGEILQEHTEEHVAEKAIRTTEPPYIKLYIEDVLYLSDMPKSYANLTYELAKRASFANDDEGLCVALTGFIKNKILTSLGWDNMRSLNNALAKLTKGNIIKRLGTGTYQLNPYLFGRGEWKDIESIRMSWNYDAIQGKTFSTSFTYKQEKEIDIPEKTAKAV